MVYKENRLDKVLGALGFSFSSLPFMDGNVDIGLVTAITDLFLEARFNYFDISSEYRKAATATLGALSSRYPRKSYCLSVTESGLDNYLHRFERLKIGYYDFFALDCNSINDDSLSFLMNEKKEGRIRHIGLKWTGNAEELHGKLEKYGEIEYVILPLSVGDFLSQTERKKCYEILSSSGFPVIAEAEGVSSDLRLTEDSVSGLSDTLRFLYSLDGIVCVSVPLDNTETAKAAIRAFRRRSH